MQEANAVEQSEMEIQDVRILVVDDTQANLDVLCELLEDEGYTISVAPNGEVALKIVERMRPDLILLDVMMPGINGFEVCRRLKQDEATQDIPVIFITAEYQMDKLVAGFEVGGVDYIAKPFQNEEVLVRVATHLKIDRLTRELAQKNDDLNLANAQIQEVTERKSRFLSSMAHELRTPLTAIMGYVSNLLDGIGGELGEKQRHTLERVGENSDHLLNVINDLLDLSKIEAGRMDVNPEMFRVKDLIETCCAEMAPLVKPTVKLNHVVDDFDDVDTDRTRVRQILINLLSNAVKFTKCGTINVRAVKDGEVLILSVLDTGVGIPSDALENIFEEFQQVKGSDPEHKGTGLGLPITKGFAECLGGSICVESEVGKGSTFTVCVPAVYKEAQESRICKASPLSV